MEKFGKMAIESDVEELILSRQIAKTVIEFGVSPKQLLQVIKLLATEIENIDDSRSIVSVVKSIQNRESSNSIIIS